MCAPAARLEELSKHEQGMAADLAGFRRRVAEQREAASRDLGIVRSRVLDREHSNLSSRNSECASTSLKR